MNYPEYFTADNIMEFEYEYNRYLDLEDPYNIETINAELQSITLIEEKEYFEIPNLSFSPY
jgi:poly-beta-hydroxyalkanoate depolymerase